MRRSGNAFPPSPPLFFLPPLPLFQGERERRHLARVDKFPNSTARSEVRRPRASPNMRAEDGFPVATRRSMIMVALAIRDHEPMRAERAKAAFATDEARWEAVRRRDRAAD